MLKFLLLPTKQPTYLRICLFLKYVSIYLSTISTSVKKDRNFFFRLAQDGMIFLFQNIFMFYIECFLKAHPNFLNFKKEIIQLKL